MSKKRIIAAIALAACLAAAGGTYVYNEYVRTQNVFDQMYHTRMDSCWQTASFFAREVYYGGMFSNMKQVESYANVDAGMYYISYKDECLDPGTALQLAFFPASDDEPDHFFIQFEIGTRDDEDRTWYSYEYDLSTRTLTYTSNDPGNAERKAFLYDILLEDWFEANPNTRFSMDDLGDYTFVDGTM